MFCFTNNTNIRHAGVDLVPLLDWTPKFDGFVVWWGWKSTRHKDACYTKVKQCRQILITIPHSTTNTTGRNYMFNQGVNICAFLIIATNS